MRNQNLPANRNGPRGMLTPFDLLQQRIDSMFEDFTSGFGMPRMFDDGGMALNPALDMHEADGKLTISAELPGVDEKDIDIAVDDQVLTISGEKKSEVEHKDGDRYRSERSYGRFSRSVSLPFTIDPDKVEARFDKGVLKLAIERPADAAHQPRKIPIKH